MDKTDDVSRKRQPFAGDNCPPENAAQIEARKIVWEAKLQQLIEKKGNSRNAHVLPGGKISHVISMLERLDCMSWAVRLLITRCMSSLDIRLNYCNIIPRFRTEYPRVLFRDFYVFISQ